MRVLKFTRPLCLVGSRDVQLHGFPHRRSLGTSPSASISDRDIAKLAARPLHSLTLEDLVKNGRPPLSQEALCSSANFAISTIPNRLAGRIQALRSLPFIVVTNPHVAQIHNIYMHSLTTLLPYAGREIDSKEDEHTFTEVMAGLVQAHTNTIPILARGFLESRKYISPSAVTSFLDTHLRLRIGTRLIAENHIFLHYESQPTSPVEESSFVGVVDTALKPASIIRTCESFVADICELQYGVRPTIVINGEPETTIGYIPTHLEYIMTELLKNAFRATVERGHEREPIEVTIAPAPDSASTTDPTTPAPPGLPVKGRSRPGVTIRIRDRGGGISPENYLNLWNYGFTTFNEREASDATGNGVDALDVISGASNGGSTLAGLGYGLPLSKAYAEHFGGGIRVQSLYGWGTDVYLTLKGVSFSD